MLPVKTLFLLLASVPLHVGMRLRSRDGRSSRQTHSYVPLIPVLNLSGEDDEVKTNQSANFWIRELGDTPSPWWKDSRSNARFQIFSDSYMHGDFPALVAVTGKVDGIPSLHFIDQRLPEEKQRWRKAASLFGKVKTTSDEWKALIAEEGNSMEESMADFLMNAPEVDRIQAGEYLSANTDTSRHVLRLLLRKIDFENQPMVEALRRLFAYFKPGGEAQSIDRVVETFSEVYWEVQPKLDSDESMRYIRNSNSFEEGSTPLHHQDTVHVLAFSILLLNTDLSNSNIKKKMTVNQFISNNRGIDSGYDLPKEFLKHIYDEISSNPISLDAGVAVRGKELFILRCRKYSSVCKVLPPGAQDKQGALLKLTTSYGLTGVNMIVSDVGAKTKGEQTSERCESYSDGKSVHSCSNDLLATLDGSRIAVEPGADAAMALAIALIRSPSGHPAYSQTDTE